MRSGAGSTSEMGFWTAIFIRLTGLSIPVAKATMRKMSLLELLFALLLVCLLAVMAGVAFLVWNLVRRAEGQARDVAELKLRLQAGGQRQTSQSAELRERLAQTQSVIEGLRSALSARQPVEEEARARPGREGERVRGRAAA